MSYNVDELFGFRKIEDGYAIEKYLKADDPTITALEIPEEYNSERVTTIYDFSLSNSKYIKCVIIPPSVRYIASNSFNGCTSLESAEFSEGLGIIGSFAFRETNLKSIMLPKSLNTLYWGAFRFCLELERVEFNSSPAIELNVFSGCPKLPPETVIMGLVRSTDIKEPIHCHADLMTMTEKIPGGFLDCFRPDVFEILAKNNSFINCDLKHLFVRMIEENKPELMPIAERYGMLENARRLDTLIDFSTKNQRVEITAYLLELKKRKFGFNGGDDFEL